MATEKNKSAASLNIKKETTENNPTAGNAEEVVPKAKKTSAIKIKDKILLPELQSAEIPVTPKKTTRKKPAVKEAIAIPPEENAPLQKEAAPVNNNIPAAGIHIPAEIPSMEAILRSEEVPVAQEEPLAKEAPPVTIQPVKKTAAPKKAAVAKKKTVGQDTAAIAKKSPVKKAVKAEAVKKEKPAAQVTTAIEAPVISNVKITFVARYHTKHGQSLYITGGHAIFGENDIAVALPMQYLNNDLWTATINLDTHTIPEKGISYNYLLRLEDNSVSYDWGKDKVITRDMLAAPELLIIDAWNFAGYYENAFYTEPFKNVLLKHATSIVASAQKTYTHTFKIKAPLLQPHEAICLLGNDAALGNWEEEKVVRLFKNQEEDFYTARVDLSKANFPVIYKYCVYNLSEKRIVRYEQGENRLLYDVFVNSKKTVVNDGFIILSANTWKGAGVAIPVFSLRSKDSCGIGEFTDLKLLVDWAKATGLKLIQLLPVNDTTATHSWTDSYPYAAISAFALHPIYLNLAKAAGEGHNAVVQKTATEQQRLNKLEEVDYEAVYKLKWEVIKELYPLQKEDVFTSEDYKTYLALNKDWLVPYAAFCYFRDKYNSADFNTWQSHKMYDAAAVEALLDPAAETHDALAIYLYVQYLLHLQLKEAAAYAHNNGIIVKGDIPIGIYRYGADAWQHPELYHMDMQSGAPPDDFAVTGQNWGFPTYNWEKMREDGFGWWKQRFEQMSYYFDAFRIDHILGFFRIWSIPTHSAEGIMGHFEPSIPVHINEFNQKNIWFDYERYCKPYITERLLNETLGDQKEHIKYTFLDYKGYDRFQLKPAYDTQQKLENYFSWQQDNAHNQWLKKQLFSYTSNVILFEVEGSNGQQFHFRFGMEDTGSFRELDHYLQQQLKELYVDYFFKRQDAFWMYEAMQKLPALKRATNMLVCGEDLGLVPGCVPEVMRQLGLLSLEIQRMPKDASRQFFHPADAPYLSVVTPSTHDISTIRGWWEENRDLSQKFYNDELGQWGRAPYLCDAWVNKAIVAQHLYSPAMWSIFQLQDILGINRKIRRLNPHEERINVPANPKHYWHYRMHLTLEALMQADEFNAEFSDMIKASGRDM